MYALCIVHIIYTIQVHDVQLYMYIVCIISCIATLSSVTGVGSAVSVGGTMIYMYLGEWGHRPSNVICPNTVANTVDTNFHKV